MTSQDLNAVMQQLAQSQSLYIAVAVVLLASVLFLISRRQPKNVVAYSTENGDVLVSRHAIVELVRTSCEQLEDVAKPSVKVRVKGKTTHFEVRIKLQSGGHMREIEQTLQGHLRRALSENLGIESLGRITIIATGFKSARIDSSEKGRERATKAGNSGQDGKRNTADSE